ncbi:MFS transporter [Citricoccus sp. NPDC055426]|uniref:MFS transporter n=1 Tax=Citricoccus sp. NPDC055426 TaxID=3155536 RepID=UPI00341CFDFE
MTPETASPVPRVTAFATAVLVFGAVNAPTVLYAAWRAEFGFSATVQTLVYAMYVGGLIPGLLLTGRWLRRHSPRTLMVLAAAASVVAALALALAGGAGMLLAARFIQGLALGVVMSASSAALYGAAPPRARSFTALLVTLTALVGACLGPVLAGALADLSAGTTLPMLVAGACVAAVMLLLLVHGRSPAPPATPAPTGPSTGPLVLGEAGASAVVPAESPAAEPTRETAPASAPMLAPRSHLMISLTAGTSWAMVGLYQSVGPGLIGTALGVESLTVLGGIVAAVLAVAGIVQVSARNVPVQRGRRLGLSALLVGIGGFAAMLATGQVWWALIAAVGAGVGHGFTFFSATQEIGEFNRRRPLGAAASMSRYFTIAYLCLAAFTLLLGIVGDLWAMVPAAVTLLGILAAGCVAMLFSRNATPTP